MKIKKIQGAIIIIAAAVGVVFWVWPTYRNELPVLNMEDSSNKVLLIDNISKNYSDSYCRFLKNSSSLNPADIKDVYCCVNDLYILFSDRFIHYDIFTGALLFQYNPEKKVNFIDFSFNQSNQRAYILDNLNSELFELTLDGDVIKTMQLDSAHTYSKIECFDNQTFMVAVQTVPSPSFISVDFRNDEIKHLETDFNNRRKKYDIPANSDSIWSRHPLYVTNKTPLGIMVKYLFDDQVYLFNENDVEPVYVMKMGKQKVKFQHPLTHSKLKNNERFRIIKFWHSKNKTYVVSQRIVENIKGIFDYRMLSQFNNLKIVDGFGGFVAERNLATLYPNKEEVFMDDEFKRFLSFKKINKMEKQKMNKWPRHMLKAENKDDLVVSVFYMR